ncbi:MAG: hypothetical protein EHM20_16005, partial [Alphaproteobacteria bacterium]
FDTRPWMIFGEGPTVDKSNPISGPGFNEANSTFTSSDIRFNQKGDFLYATLLGVPTSDIYMKSLGNKCEKAKIKNIEILGSTEKISWKQYSDSLLIEKPKIIPNNIAVVFKIIMEEQSSALLSVKIYE